MKKPRHLYNFPCMYPWIGSRYGCDGRRLAIVAESHYLPPGVTCLNRDPAKWYAARQESVPDNARSYMDTRKSVEDRHQSDNDTYRNIEAVVSFEEIAFFNYVFRPAEKGKPGYSQTSEFDIVDKDREISSEIMEWFIRKHQPTAIVIASATVMQYTCVRCDLAAHPEIKICITDHPTASLAKPSNTEPPKSTEPGEHRIGEYRIVGEHRIGEYRIVGEHRIVSTESSAESDLFLKDVREFLKNPSHRGSQAGLPFRLNKAQRARCRSYRRSARPASDA